MCGTLKHTTEASVLSLMQPPSSERGKEKRKVVNQERGEWMEAGRNYVREIKRLGENVKGMEGMEGGRTEGGKVGRTIAERERQG